MTNEKRRPGTNPEAATTGDLRLSDSDDLTRATAVLRVATLRAAANELFEAEATGEHLTLCPDTGEMGRLAAHLLDAADLVEVAEREGWFS